MGLRGTQGMWPLRWLNCKGSQLVRGINLASRWCTGPHNIIFLATSSHAEYCFLLRKGRTSMTETGPKSGLIL
ncbi:hypothetical protein EJB05_04478 [Eragrostis curvula]|uniref:Uncharacterized protein n=1 Tax=Eragrostis curvula TaxID=38414 RepID=A0A5J9WC83_9POAL|nr:hypothetical protein EJB05_04478 [Eragrostis curvula]